jgi:hypothetical protein
VLKAWNKSRWRQEPLTLKQLHDKYARAWADQTDEPVPWEPREEDEEKKVGWRLVESRPSRAEISGPASLQWGRCLSTAESKPPGWRWGNPILSWTQAYPDSAAIPGRPADIAAFIEGRTDDREVTFE